MSIFGNFNNQGLDNDVAFEEMCCQLFETWGARTMQFGSGWEYLDIRGDGGDGGIEAFWHNVEDDRYIGLQAKWFVNTISKSQYQQIKKSIDTAVALRPTLTQYIVCIPHNLTSLRNIRGGTVSRGEEADWKTFRDDIVKAHAGLDILLWDEHCIGNFLQEPANEGRWRFWFEKSAVNPDNVRLALNKAIETLKDRYVPEIADDGELASFLDNFFGSVESRKLAIKDIDAALAVCHDLAYTTDSFTRIGGSLSGEMKDSAIRCHDAVSAYAKALRSWRQMLVAEPQSLVEIDNIVVDYGAIEDFEAVVRTLKEKYQLAGHVDELIKLIDRFRELLGEYEISSTMRNAFSCSHCLVVGEQGTGKTCGFASEASSFSNSGEHLPIFVRATDVDDQSDWRNIVSDAVGLSGWGEVELWQALSSSAAMQDIREDGITVRAKVTIFVDGLDEKEPVSRWTTLIRQGDSIANEYPRIRFAYSTRPHGISRIDSGELRSCTYYVNDDGDVPVRELFDRYIEHYSIDLAGNTHYKWLLRIPMELRMFCTAYSGRRIDREVSTCLTSLVNAEVDRLDEEYAARRVNVAGMQDAPVRTSLLALATAFLADDAPRERDSIGAIIEGVGLQYANAVGMIDYLEVHGILATERRPGAMSVSPDIVMYKLGSRHLWDYFMAVVLMETDTGKAAEALLRHSDAAYLYSVLLVEKRGFLPLESDELVNALGNERARQLTIDALASAEKEAAGKFRQWALDEMARSDGAFREIVNGIVVQVADIPGHALGPLMFDEYMRSFQTPIERDLVWSTPRKMYDDYGLSMYYERDAVKHLPQLHDGDTWNQMPLILAWCLSSVSNLRRRHCRNELVRWAMRNPGEYVELFGRFNDCDDLQVREDMFVIAEEVVCQGNADAETKRRFAEITLGSVFDSPDVPGNRDAALRYYGRMLVEKCCADGVLDPGMADRCRPPYRIENGSDALPIYAEAVNSDRMGGFETIDYNLARYVLIDKLEGAFGIPQFHADDEQNAEHVQQLISSSAIAAGVEPPAFDGWVIASAYQFLVDHGYDPDVFVGTRDDKGYRIGGIDHKISRAFGSADYGSRSTVMNVAEKYVWCARNEICGFMADRIPVCLSAWQSTLGEETCDLVRDYSALLSYQSPLFEATVNRLAREREGIYPSFPAEFSCDDGNALCTEQELNDWIGSGNSDSLVALLDHAPNIKLSLKDSVIPLAIYASDWGICGKQARAWAYCGAMDTSELEKLVETGTVAIDGYDHASAFTTSINVEATYISPVEYMSAPWINEYDEDHERAKIADVHIAASPLSGSGVDSLTDIGDCWYQFPSKLAMDLCGITRTDGAHFYNPDGKAIFEDVDYGEPYRKHCQALFANKEVFFDALHTAGLHPVWYATLQRDGNRLADERIAHVEARSEQSWLIWINDEGNYCSCSMSDEYSIPECTYEPSGFIKELLDKYAGGNGETDTPNN